MNRPHLAIITALALALVAAPSALASAAHPAAAAAAPAAAPQYDHVVLILLENHSRSAITPSTAPFLSGLTQDSAYTAVTHPSLPNYIALTSGSTQGCTSDRCPTQSLDVPNIFAQLGTDARSLADTMPRNCDTGDARPYVAHHNPEVYYKNAPCATQDVPLGATPDISARFTFVTPNIEHDMHDGSVAAGDAWVRDFVNQVQATPQWQSDRTAIVITFDEGSGSDQNVYLGVLSNVGSAAPISVAASHPDLLATIETLLGQPVIGPGDASLLMPLFPGGSVSGGGGGGLVSGLSETPDPATGVATFDFTLGQAAPLHITITDAQGNVVRRLVDFGYDWKAGADSAVWGLQDDSGNPVPAGSYTATVDAHAADGSSGSASVGFHVG